MPLSGQNFNWGGSFRGYQFLQVEEGPLQGRRDTEFVALRLTLKAGLNPNIQIESHGLFNFVSPRIGGVSRLATTTTGSFLPMQHRFIDDARADLTGSFDRLNLQIEIKALKIVAGRQPITWGVSYFWPSMDLFAPFAPQQIDRDYKPGVDALRITLPVGAYSEVEVIGAVLGSSLSKDGAAGVLGRIYLGSVDVGLIGGRFHKDTVAGGFFAANVQGTGLRGEVTWTRSGDPGDLALGRRHFWRGALGMDRQLSPEFVITAELSWNGFGAGRASEYALVAAADRLRRGEINALGRLYSGVSGNWQLHPLWKLGNSLLVNWRDPSILWVPSLAWSTGNNSEVLLGGQLSLSPRLQNGNIPGSEYGSAPNTLFVGLRAYF